MKTWIRQIQTNIKDQGTEVTNSETVLGTILVILSGIVLYADKIVDYWNIPINYEFEYYNNAEVFIWVVTATISPLLLILGYWIRPYRWALASPLAAYSVQLMYIWRDEKWIQRDYFWYWTIAFMIGFYLFIKLYQEVSKRTSRAELIQTIRSLFSFIYTETDKKGYIKPELKNEYSKRRIELTDKAVGNES